MDDEKKLEVAALIIGTAIAIAGLFDRPRAVSVADFRFCGGLPPLPVISARRLLVGEQAHHSTLEVDAAPI